MKDFLLVKYIRLKRLLTTVVKFLSEAPSLNSTKEGIRSAPFVHSSLHGHSEA